MTLDWQGVVGDSHAGLTRRADVRVPHYPRGSEIRNERQVTVVAADELAATAEALDLPEIRPEWLGANMMLAGIPHLTLLPPATRLLFASGAAIVVDWENQPCTGPGRVIAQQYHDDSLTSRFVKAALQKRGFTAWVERTGAIAVGDAVTVVIPPQPRWPGL
jgi:MOSC domain-containing protein YiiM